MSVEIKGDVTVVINNEAKKEEPSILIWTIGSGGVETTHIDATLEKVFPDQYSQKDDKLINEKRITPQHHMGD